MNIEETRSVLKAFEAVRKCTQPGCDREVIQCYHTLRARLAELTGVGGLGYPEDRLLRHARRRVSKRASEATG